MRPRMFIDLDGVVANWEGMAIRLCGLDEKEIVPRVKRGENLEDIFPRLWDVLERRHDDFWDKLELYPWSEELYERAQQYGEVAFLSSGGNLHRRTDSVGYANYGKTRWVARNFPDAKLILTREKYLCAGPTSLLIDDTEKKLRKFEEYGGKIFHWPNAYKILEGEIDINDLYRRLDESARTLQ